MTTYYKENNIIMTDSNVAIAILEAYYISKKFVSVSYFGGARIYAVENKKEYDVLQYLIDEIETINIANNSKCICDIPNYTIATNNDIIIYMLEAYCMGKSFLWNWFRGYHVSWHDYNIYKLHSRKDCCEMLPLIRQILDKDAIDYETVLF